MSNTNKIITNLQDVQLSEEEAKAARIKYENILTANEEYRIQNIGRSINIEWPTEWEEIKNDYLDKQFNIHLWVKEYVDEDDWEHEEESQGYSSIVGIIGDLNPRYPWKLTIYHNTLKVHNIRYPRPAPPIYRPYIGSLFNSNYYMENNTNYTCMTNIDFDSDFIKIIPILD